MLISHRSTAYLDNGELERAAGLMAIESKKDGNSKYWSAVCDGACAALRTLQLHDIKTAEDFAKVFGTAMYIPD